MEHRDLAPLDSDEAHCDGLATLGLHELGEASTEALDWEYRNEKGEIEMHISLRGYPRDMGQVVSCTGQTQWRGGELLADWCWQSRHDKDMWSKSVIELGAGLGLCSLVAAKCGADTVVATDGDELALEALRANLESNNKIVIARRLRWGDSETIQDLRSEFASSNNGFGLVLAADVVYDQRSVAPLISTVTKLIAPRSGLFVLSFTHRGVNLDILLEEASRAGLSVITDATPTHGDDRLSSNADRLLIFSWTNRS